MKRGSHRAALLVWALLLAFGWTGNALAQGVTTAAVTGRVTNQQGAPVQGASVVATNVATGAGGRVVTRADGRYLISGLQPGAYRIQVSGLGYAAQTRSADLALGQQQNFDFTLAAEAIQLEGLVATAEQGTVISRGRTGATTILNDSVVTRTPNLNRNFADLTRLVPQASTSSIGATSVAGRNNRFNSIQIDGAVNNDVFGLAASGTPGGQADAKPISLEAIQEFQVVIAPFDVRQGGFTGAAINAVTKSGTNRFSGSVSAFLRNESLVGNYRLYNGDLSSDFDNFDQQEYAFSFGGPIARDRAFFFLAGEFTRRTAPVNVVAGTDAALGITVTQAEQVADALDALGYDPGSTLGRDIERNSDNFFGRLDLNLTDNHRFTIRHNYVDSFRDDFSRSARSYTLGNGGYRFVSETNSTVGQLNSSFFGGAVFNELRVGYTTVRDQRQVGDAFPRVEVVFGNSGSVVAGTENFSGRNALDQDILEITNDLTFSAGVHNITLGTSNEFFEFSNLFVRNPFGNYRFGSFADFQAGRPNRYEYSYPADIDPNTPGTQAGPERAEFKANRYAFYLQDRIDVLDNLEVTVGLRYDIARLPEAPLRNQALEQFYPGYRTDLVPRTMGLFNPRIGFNWDVTGDAVTQVRGGTGLFSGRTPFVWISNAYGNTGLEFVRFTCTNAAAPNFVADPANQPRNCAGATSPAANEINLVDRHFSPPQVWRSSLAVDRRLPFGFVGTVEGLYTKTVKDVLYQNLRVQRDGMRMVEGRPGYRTRSGTPTFGDVILMTNTDEGYTASVTGQLQRNFEAGWSFSAAYTYSQARDKNPLGSSQAISNWRFNVTEGDPNNPALTRSDFEIPHRIVLNASRQFQFLRNAPTDLSVVYVGQSGRPYSFRYNDDVNGDGSFGNDLLYVPRFFNEVRFEPSRAPGTNGASDRGQPLTPEQSWQNLNAFIERVECLRENRGEVIGRNECWEPWSNRFDVRIAQVIPTFRGQGAQLTIDILNFGNLINDEWGRSEFVSNQTIPLLGLASGTGLNNAPDANGRRLYSAFAPRNDVFSISNVDSRYQIQVGIRYAF